MVYSVNTEPYVFLPHKGERKYGSVRVVDIVTSLYESVYIRDSSNLTLLLAEMYFMFRRLNMCR